MTVFLLKQQLEQSIWTMNNKFKRIILTVLVVLVVINLFSCNNGSVLEVSANGSSFRMILIEGGQFTMGATEEQKEYAYPNEYPAHQEKVENFYLAEIEVTQELWESIMEDSVSTLLKESNRDIRDFGKAPDLPVYCVSYLDIIEFLNKLNAITHLHFRLPTEKEWEFAARGGNKSQTYRYSGSNEVESVCWYVKNSNNIVHNSKDKDCNELGLYGMSGNVMEYCSDSLIIKNGEREELKRIVKGGGIYSWPEACRVSWRDKRSESHRDYDHGFRLALDYNDK